MVSTRRSRRRRVRCDLGFLGWRHPEAVSMRKIGHLVAPIVVIIGLCLLMFDAKAGLDEPLRFALLLTNFGSP